MDELTFISKDKRLSKLPSDVVSRLYTELDTYDLDKADLHHQVAKRMEDNTINPLSVRVSVTMSLGAESWG